MGLFGEKKTKEEKQRNKVQKVLEKYQLDEINDKDLQVIKRIMVDLAGNNFFKAGMALSFSKPENQAKVTYLSALVEQNWMIIRQLGRLNKNIGEMNTQISD